MRDETWKARVTEWIEQQDCAHRLPVQMEHYRTEAWSSVWRVQTAGAAWWFKENTSANPGEGAVQAVLARLAPGHVMAPLAWDVDRGWLLTSDGGTTLMDSAPERRGVDLDTVPMLLVDYAHLQRLTLGHRDELVGAGLPDADVRGTVERARSVVAEMAAHPVGDPRHLTGAQVEAILGSMEGLNASVETLRSGPVPMAFDHNDLFPRNVYRPIGAGEPYRFFDFAESVWAHPFGSLVMFQWELRHQWGIESQEHEPVDCRDPRIRQVFDAYLAQWQDLTDLATLRSLLGHALRIAPLHRAWVWLRVLEQAPEAVARHGGTPRAWITDLSRPVLV